MRCWTRFFIHVGSYARPHALLGSVFHTRLLVCPHTRAARLGFSYTFARMPAHTRCWTWFFIHVGSYARPHALLDSVFHTRWLVCPPARAAGLGFSYTLARMPARTRCWTRFFIHVCSYARPHAILDSVFHTRLLACPPARAAQLGFSYTFARMPAHTRYWARFFIHVCSFGVPRVLLGSVFHTRLLVGPPVRAAGLGFSYTFARMPARTRCWTRFFIHVYSYARPHALLNSVFHTRLLVCPPTRATGLGFSYTFARMPAHTRYWARFFTHVCSYARPHALLDSVFHTPPSPPARTSPTRSFTSHPSYTRTVCALSRLITLPSASFVRSK
jgi:hypothetical protein